MAVSIRKEHARHSRHVTRTARWQVLRHVILERDGWTGRTCGTRTGRLEVDHVKPVRDEPDHAFDPGNLQVLCSSCHGKKTRAECGFKPSRPERSAWGSAVAELAGRGKRHFSLPFDLRRSQVPVLIFYGPPGAGKSNRWRA